MLRPSFAGLALASAVALVLAAGAPAAAQPDQAPPSSQPSEPQSQPPQQPQQPQQEPPPSPGPAPAPAQPPPPAPEGQQAPPTTPAPPSPQAPEGQQATAAPAAPQTITPAQVAPQAIEGATFQPDIPLAQQPALLVKVEVLLDRAHNSPGAIDGRPGTNLDHALGIYAHEHNLQPVLNSPMLASLQKVGGGPITQNYTITPQDEAGPFIGHLPSDFYAQSKFRHMGYTSPEQELAERFHMSPRLLEAMNPGADFSKAGTQIAVVRPHTGGLGAQVTKITVDKRIDEVMAYGADGKLIASFPSTIGSADHPAPSGDYTVAQVRPDPAYVYDPRVLTWGPRRHGRFTIKPGPNNPTGVIWIGLSKPTYGIHGSPNADLIGKTASHGCVRLTNWDAWDLGNAVKPGAEVAFISQPPEQTAAAGAKS